MGWGLESHGFGVAWTFIQDSAHVRQVSVQYTVTTMFGMPVFNTCVQVPALLLIPDPLRAQVGRPYHQPRR